MKELLIIILLVCVIQISVGHCQDGSLENDSVKAELTTGLKDMLNLLKKGQKHKALIWFKNNYYALHKHQLLADSVIEDLAKKTNSSIKTTFSNTDANKDSLINSELHQFILNELQDIAMDLGESPDTILPKSFIKDVEKYVVLFSQNPKYQGFFQKALNKSRKYIPLIKEYFTDKGFPEELLFFIIIESGFDENAISKAGAAGMFQFMPATARQYGLNVDKTSDERFSAIKSAKASSDYLKDLYLELGDITLALTSYNSGSGKTRSALKELSTLRERGFWAIREQSTKLAKETREYVPQIFAAIVIAKKGNSERFQFKDPGFPIKGDYTTFILPESINIQTLISSLNISKNLFFSLNPDIDPKESNTPADVADYPLFVPIEKKEQCLRLLTKRFGPKRFDGSEPITAKQTTIHKKPKPKTKKKKRKTSYNLEFVKTKDVYKSGDEFTYLVKRANTLHLVARIFKVSEKDLIKWNGLRYKSLKRGQELTITAPEKVTKYVYEIQQRTSYRKIALQFNVNANSLKKTNDIKGEFLSKGDLVEIYSFK